MYTVDIQVKEKNMENIKIRFIVEKEDGEVLVDTPHFFVGPDDAHSFDIETCWTSLIGEVEDLLKQCDMCFRQKCSCDRDVDNSRDK